MERRIREKKDRTKKQISLESIIPLAKGLKCSIKLIFWISLFIKSENEKKPGKIWINERNPRISTEIKKEKIGVLEGFCAKTAKTTAIERKIRKTMPIKPAIAPEKSTLPNKLAHTGIEKEKQTGIKAAVKTDSARIRFLEKKVMGKESSKKRNFWRNTITGTVKVKEKTRPEKYIPKSVVPISITKNLLRKKKKKPERIKLKQPET